MTDYSKVDTALIDGDILVYSVCKVTEFTASFGDDVDIAYANIPEAMHISETLLESWLNKLEVKKCVIAFSGRDIFRKKIYPPYKAHRKVCRKPCGYAAIKRLFKEKYKVLCEDKIEGDDILGLMQTEKTIIVSQDKDLNGIPGWSWNPDKDEQGRFIEEKEADLFFFKQTLMGDKTDGYPGLEGVGPVTANKILKKGVWEEVEQAFVNSGYTPSYALIQAQCARILRAGEYDWDKQEVKLWTPQQA